ncbi:Short-chain dehydrogenase/reductase family protein [Mycena venus]|uniref:Short-chain dehydrogenase/reductase family protein n=1 Tax=Mycena venus TaxID=2733690 RepID=A0A8H6X6P1_9AGAR|nr:Short-chain dehydrogenase/reductase family protein [Mycena venus]
MISSRWPRSSDILPQSPMHREFLLGLKSSVFYLPSLGTDGSHHCGHLLNNIDILNLNRNTAYSFVKLKYRQAPIIMSTATEPTFSFATTAEEVATTFSNEIKGKNVLITGSSVGGLGFETARVIAKYAKLVVITGYDEERLKLSEDAIKKDVPNANIHRLTLNLTSFASIRKAAEAVNANPEPLHVLINNAAAPFVDFKLTEDGLETQLATDHVGPFLLTKLLTPKLLGAATPTYTPRVVFVSSVGHSYGTGVDFEALTSPKPEKYVKPNAYFQAKSANILTAIELSKRSNGKINAYSLNPGSIFTNGFTNANTVPLFKEMGLLLPDGKPNPTAVQWKTIPQGAATTVAAAFDPQLNDKPGAYLEDSVVANDKVASHSSDPVTAEKLWTVTEQLIGEKFTF